MHEAHLQLISDDASVAEQAAASALWANSFSASVGAVETTITLAGYQAAKNLADSRALLHQVRCLRRRLRQYDRKLSA